MSAYFILYSACLGIHTLSVWENLPCVAEMVGGSLASSTEACAVNCQEEKKKKSTNENIHWI